MSTYSHQYHIMRTPSPWNQPSDSFGHSTHCIHVAQRAGGNYVCS